MAVRLQFEGIRCFSARQDAVVRPLTLLLGENSSGKSTFLALCQIASAIVRAPRGPYSVSFNEAPFLLGAYDQIASYRSGRAGRAKSFSVGVHVDEEPDSSSILATFVPESGQPFLKTWRLAAGGTSLQVEVGNGQRGFRGVVESAKGTTPFAMDRPWELEVLLFRELTDLPLLKPVLTDHELAGLQRAWVRIADELEHRPYAFAPIRTNPQRTYDPVAAEPKPEGSHVPMLLAELSHSATKDEWAALQSSLKEFGEGSGLFEQIEVVRKGKKESDPFQIGVKSGGPTFNLVDVGYGVSQVLPILVDTLQRTKAKVVFLMQQPEVHLHPRAQAELGSFFARRANKRQRFVVETHSDYLVDRVRMEVRRGKRLKPQDVSILYFERPKRGAMIHCLELDKRGTIVNPPAGYRQFFMDEERNILDY